MHHYTVKNGVKSRVQYEYMILVWALSWWYGGGWKARIDALREQLVSSYDYFSIGMLLSTLFAPYKQISAGSVSGPIGVRWRAFVDRLMSRIIGAFVRLLFVVVGCAWLMIQSVFGALVVVLWGFVPFVPLIGFVLMLSGWVPTWR